MESLYGPSTPKEATNLSINGDLLRQARELGIDLSQALDLHLEKLVAQFRREQWLSENRSAIDQYNRRVGRRDAFGDGFRRF